jgi:hypothetical protein
MDAPSVGNVPRAATTVGTTAQRREAPEASTGHMGPPGPAGRQQLPQRGPHVGRLEQQQHAHQAQQAQPLASQQDAAAAPRHNQRQWHGPAGRHPRPTASTGTSRPPCLGAAGAAAAALAASGAAAHGSPAAPTMASGRAAMRPRRHLGLEQSSALPEGSHAGLAGMLEGAAAAPVAGQASAAAEAPLHLPPPLHTHNLRRQQQQQHAASAQRQQQQQQEVEEGEGGAAAPTGGADPLGNAGAQQAQQEEPRQAQQAASLILPQPTMLSGRGPSTVGNFLPASQQAQQGTSETEVGAASFGHERGGGLGSGGAVDQAATGAGGGQVATAVQQGPPDSAVGAILHVAGGQAVVAVICWHCHWQ